MSGIQDTDKDGSIDKDDFVGEQGAANMIILRKEMLNANNPTSKKMFIDWQTEELRKHHATGKARRDMEQRSKGGGGRRTTSTFSSNMNIQENWFNPSQLENLKKYVIEGTSFKLGRGDNQNTYTFENNSWWKNKGSEAEVEIGDAETLIFNEFGSAAGAHSGFQGLTTKGQGAGSTAGGEKLTLGSTHRETINALWNNPAEDTAKETLNTMLSTLGIDKRVSIPWKPGESIIRLDEVEYDLEIAKHKNDLIIKILELQGGQQATVTNFG